MTQDNEEEHFGRGIEIIHAQSFFNVHDDRSICCDDVLPVLPKEHSEFFGPGLKTNLLLTIFSFFNGADLYHVMSRLNKKLRLKMSGSGLLDQEKVIVIKQGLNIRKLGANISYAFSLIDRLDFILTGKFSIQKGAFYTNVLSILLYHNSISDHKVRFGLQVQDGSWQEFKRQILRLD
jgi:hypothetical protein